ncbi:hypothetical protein DEW08_25455 (plasmid) [Azospirillum thermophilum]|uniref:NADH:ubiquinone oxidoreductase 30kDa subunit domain-containing protein n=2 Tax=Azospirillum thermophilum TaxID=2202148 RepID=A0A2S2CZ36_9PROT|nr:hypothetical protein DEW08_25455 [Azospirillum thermophilum]
MEHIRAIPGVVSVAARNGSLWAEGPFLDVEAMAGAMDALGIRLGTVTAIPLSEDGETTVIYHYIDEYEVINFKTATRNGVLASLAASVRPASWAEREIKDLFAVDFPGHPNLVPLLRPEGFEPGMLRAAMCAPAAMTRSPVSPLARK